MFLFEVELEVIFLEKRQNTFMLMIKVMLSLLQFKETIKELNCSKEDISTILVKKVNNN